MKIKPYETEKFLGTLADSSYKAVLIFGPDGGGVRLTAEKTVKNILKNNTDPFNLRSLSAALVASDAALLTQNAGNLSLGGGRVVVKVRGAGDNCTKALTHFLAAENVEGIVVIDAGNLTPRSTLRKLAEKEKNVAALACYADNPQQIASLIQNKLKAAGLNIERDGLITFTQRLGSDRAITENEIEKLILYMGSTKTVRLEDVLLATGDMAALGLDDLADCVGLGEMTGVVRRFDWLISSGLYPVGILNNLSNHFQKLRFVLAFEGDIINGIQKLIPPLHFSRKDKFIRQCRVWNLTQTSKALQILWDSNIKLRTNSSIAVCSQTLLSLALRAQKLSAK